MFDWFFLSVFLINEKIILLNLIDVFVFYAVKFKQKDEMMKE